MPRGDPLVVMWYVRYPLSLRQVEDLAFERRIDLCHGTARKWVDRFGPMYAAEIRRKRVQAMRQQTHWRWHLDEVFVKFNGETHYHWRVIFADEQGLTDENQEYNPRIQHPDHPLAGRGLP
jgi:putative transposase